MKKAIVLAVMTALAAGCISRQARREKAIEYKSADTAALVAAYNDNASKIHTLRAHVEMTLYLTDKGRTKRHTVDAWLDVEKPGHIWLKHDSMGRDLFFVVSNGKEFWVALDRSLTGDGDKVYTGEISALENESILRPDRLLAAFSLATLPPEGTKATAVRSYNDRYVLTFLDGSEPPKVLGEATFSRADLKLSRFEAFDAEGRLALAVEYRALMDISGVEAPAVVYVDWPLEGMAMLAKARKAEIGVTFPAKLWEFRWRKDAEVIHVERGEAQEKTEPRPSEVLPQ